MNKLSVVYEGWGERWKLGTIADNGREILFEYSDDALAQALELSPRHLRLGRKAYGEFPAYLHHLPGLLEDCLPDGWGMLLMDRMFRRRGFDSVRISPLDRLAFIGSRAVGALSFMPDTGEVLSPRDLTLLSVANEVREVMTGDNSGILEELAYLGGSPQGARPKVLVYYDPASNRVGTGAFEGGEPWMIKFPGELEHKEVCEVEFLYSEFARLAGQETPITRHFDLGPNLAAFGIARFDVKNDMRVPVHTLAGFLHANFRIPSSVDYTTFMRATRMLTRDEREVEKAYERAVFNVLFNNRDDHGKNFSYILDVDRNWKLAPCYDLTFSEGPGGEHHMDVCGYGKEITRAHLLTLARQGGVSPTEANRTIDRMLDVSEAVEPLISRSTIREATRKQIIRAISGNRRLLIR